MVEGWDFGMRWCGEDCLEEDFLNLFAKDVG